MRKIIAMVLAKIMDEGEIMFVKICGVTCEKDISYIEKAKPDFAGMILFFPKSKRNISLSRAKKLKGEMPEGIETVAVCVSPSLEQVLDIRDAGFSYIQIHGKLSVEVLDALDKMGHPERMEVPDMRKLKVIRAYNKVEEEELAEIEKLRERDEVFAFLFDAKEPGSGVIFDWTQIPDQDFLKKPYFLSGGLNPGNVYDAVRKAKPDGVDASSGVELSVADASFLANLMGVSSLVDDSLYGEGHCRQSDLSMKDMDKIQVFVEKARKAANTFA